MRRPAASARSSAGLPARPTLDTIVADAWRWHHDTLRSDRRSRRTADRRVTAFLRLLEYARPYRGRLAGAVAAMVVYGTRRPASPLSSSRSSTRCCPPAGRSADRLADPRALPRQGRRRLSLGYLMTDVGQRVVRDLRNVLFRHILGQSAAFFSSQTTGRLMSRITNDVARCSARCRRRRRSDARVALARRLRRPAVLHTTRAWRWSA